MVFSVSSETYFGGLRRTQIVFIRIQKMRCGFEGFAKAILLGKRCLRREKEHRSGSPESHSWFPDQLLTSWRRWKRVTQPSLLRLVSHFKPVKSGLCFLFCILIQVFETYKPLYTSKELCYLFLGKLTLGGTVSLGQILRPL